VFNKDTIRRGRPERYIIKERERKGNMKSLFIVIGLAIALSVGAQTTTTEEKQEPAQAEKGKTKAEENVKTDREHAVDQSVTEREKTRVNDQQKVNRTEREAAPATRMEGGAVSHSTTVFRNGHESNEHLDLHRSTRARTDVHFAIGTHPRDWWLRTYTIVLMDGCHYYLADNGWWYPAYGFDPSCNYPEGVVYCE